MSFYCQSYLCFVWWTVKNTFNKIWNLKPSQSPFGFHLHFSFKYSINSFLRYSSDSTFSKSDGTTPAIASRHGLLSFVTGINNSNVLLYNFQTIIREALLEYRSQSDGRTNNRKSNLIPTRMVRAFSHIL